MRRKGVRDGVARTEREDAKIIKEKEVAYKRLGKVNDEVVKKEKRSKTEVGKICC